MNRLAFPVVNAVVQTHALSNLFRKDLCNVVVNRPQGLLIIYMHIYVHSQSQPLLLFTDYLLNLLHLLHRLVHPLFFSSAIFIRENCLFNIHTPFCPCRFGDHIVNTCFSRAAPNTRYDPSPCV
jgi:hypothetical protein